MRLYFAQKNRLCVIYVQTVVFLLCAYTCYIHSLLQIIMLGQLVIIRIPPPVPAMILNTGGVRIFPSH